MPALAADAIRTRGYCRFDGRDGATTQTVERGLERLRQALDHLPEDTHAPRANRFRRYSRGILIPWRHGHLEWVPNRGEPGDPYTEFWQGPYNPEYLDVVRRFKPIDESLRADPLLMHLVWRDFDLTFWPDWLASCPFLVGVHYVKLMVTEAAAVAVSSPDHLHQDGEPFTFVHLVARDNAAGAGNVIATPQCAGRRPEDVADCVVAEFELQEPMESYGVHDRAVSHHVTALRRGPEDRPGVRAVLLIDFTPMVPSLQ